MEVFNKWKEVADDSVKFAQQHLANERTYLAWIRTSISIVGVGFLTTSLHFTIQINSNHFIHIVAICLGIFACIVGFIIGVLATFQYSRKRKEIQDGIFNPSNRSIYIISSLFSILIFIILMYLSFLLLL
ncbi:YidH family protein [Lysinibacillus sp. NPDC097214]|uniref:YidH family protein n=1 Tax=Lysinibacillus sp. NPDC097214 TaxID=3390584 RepID=UPI003D038355